MLPEDEKRRWRLAGPVTIAAACGRFRAILRPARGATRPPDDSTKALIFSMAKLICGLTRPHSVDAK